MTALAAPRLRDACPANDVAEVAYQRLMMLLVVFGLVTILLVGRLLSFALFEAGTAFRETSTVYVPERGDIVDRNGVPMARTIYGYAIWVKPADILGDKRDLAHQLAGIFPDTDETEFYAKLTSDRPTYLRRRALPDEVRAVHALGEIAIEFPREATRLYPGHRMASHVLGFLSQSGTGRMGMEAVLQDRLSDFGERGQPVTLSLDTRVQGALERQLSDSMAATEAVGAAGIVLDVETGEVIAMATLPDFNPNKIDAQGALHQVNSVTNQVYELGSTFKPITVAAALDAGTVTNLARRYDATKPLEVGGFKIHDHELGRWLNVPEALIHSSNIVTAQIADRLGRDRLEAKLRSLGFYEPPHIELGERAWPLVPKNWGRLTTMTVGYGHGIAVTQLHLASAYAALVNGGVWRPATLMKVAPGHAAQGRRVFSAATSARMRQLLRLIVVDGTGRSADAPGFRIGGKTGSAEKPKAGGYNRTAVISTFAAAFPMDNPRYVVVATLDEPKANAESSFQRTAAWTSAPIVAKLVPRIGPMLGVYPDESRDVDVSELTPLLWSPRKGE